MKRNSFIMLIMAIAAISCTKSEVTIPAPPDDMVLIYAGADHRTPYTRDITDTYVQYTDSTGQAHWLFDGFLFLEIFDTVNEIAYTPGYKKDGKILPSAHKSDWQKVIDTYFAEGGVAPLLEQSIEETAAKIGKPERKHQIYVGMPLPIVHEICNDTTSSTSYWGSVDGRELDFSNHDDRICACHWYIAAVREAFKAGKFQNLDLAGFYFTDEDTRAGGKLIYEVGDYVRSLGFAYNWIPYFKAPGYQDWKENGFTIAYHQPNYFFNDKVPYERLKEAVLLAREAGMGMEIEFDNDAMVSRKNWAYRLRDYMRVYREEGVWESQPIAYYQAQLALYNLKNSSDKEDVELYHEFCQFVYDRPYRKQQIKGIQ